jgi:hypothetical protein
MLVLEDKKAVLIRPRHRDRFLKLMPTAKPVQYKAKTMSLFLIAWTRCGCSTTWALKYLAR